MAFQRDPIHLGSGEPVVLLHPFLLSQQVWADVAPAIAGTGRFEVFAPTMVGHHGGPKSRNFLLNVHVFADEIERQMDQLGWDTAHIVGNSLGGWVSFELERRGRARTLTAIAPAGGWRDFSPVKFEIVGKFIAGGPVLLAARLLGSRILKLPFARRIATWPLTGPADGPSDAALAAVVDDAGHCSAYLQMLVKSLTAPGLKELVHARSPIHLVTCEFDRVLPHPRYSRQFDEDLPPSARHTHLEGLGHVPMLEAPELITELIVNFIDEHSGTPQTQTG